MPEDLDAAAGVREGEILAGKYRVEKVLGVGGMGVVVAARHLDLDEKVALKFLLPHMLTDGAAVARFQREAKAAARIRSEHVARVFDVGRLQDGAPYMVMEFLEGNDLAALLARHGKMPVAQAVDFVAQACVAVADAHALGIVHRDLKPANLFCVLRSDGRASIKVLDFGISKLTDADSSGMSFTQTSAMMGSPLYMSPEQFRSAKNVDGRTDLWALGAILFELLTGRPPFSAGSVPELAIIVTTEAPPSARDLDPAVPEGLAAVITRCLQREPDRRYANVAELAVALAPFAAPATIALIDRVVGIVGGPLSGAQGGFPSSAALPAGAQSGAGARTGPAATSSRTAPALEWTAPEPPRRRSLVPALGLVGVALAGGAWWLSRSAASPGVEEATSAAPPPVATSVAAPSPAPTPVVAPTEPSPVTPAPEPSVARDEEPAPRALVPGRTAKSKPVAVTTTVRPPPPVTAAATAPRPPVAPAPSARPASPSPAPAARVNCDPPFFFDAKGNRVFKQECL